MSVDDGFYKDMTGKAWPDHEDLPTVGFAGKIPDHYLQVADADGAVYRIDMGGHISVDMDRLEDMAAEFTTLRAEGEDIPDYIVMAYALYWMRQGVYRDMTEKE